MPKAATKLLFIDIFELGLLLRAIYDLKQIECCFFMQWLQTDIHSLAASRL
jgi:hypothetical protein